MKKKLKLSELQVESFVTFLNAETANRIKTGEQTAVLLQLRPIHCTKVA